MSTAKRSTAVTFTALAMAEHEPCIGATDDWYTRPANPPPQNASDLADFHHRQRHSRRFEGKRREIAAGFRRMGRREVVQPDRCWQARSRWKGGSIPRQGPPVMRNGPLPLCVTGSRRKKVVASTYSS